MAKAAASDTTPRIPAHDTTNTARAEISGSLARIRGDSQRGTYVNGNTQAIRTTTTVTRTATDAQTTIEVLYPCNPLTTLGNWRPINRKTNDSRIRSTALHTAVSCKRVA